MQTDYTETFIAKRVYCPAEVFAFPSLLPMIPGMYAYKTVLFLMQFFQTENEKVLLDTLIGVFAKRVENGIYSLCPGCGYCPVSV